MIAPSFADIFRNNAFKNGLLPVALPEQTVTALIEILEENPWAEVEINLAENQVTLPNEETVAFEVDSFARFTLMNGMDQLDFLLSKEPSIIAYENQHGKDIR